MKQINNYTNFLSNLSHLKNYERMNTIDFDFDFEIDLDEIPNDLPTPEQIHDMMIDGLLETADVNNDGRVDFYDAFKILFDIMILDANSDGVLNEDDIRIYQEMGNMWGALRAIMVRLVLGECDVNRDGVVDINDSIYVVRNILRFDRDGDQAITEADKYFRVIDVPTFLNFSDENIINMFEKGINLNCKFGDLCSIWYLTNKFNNEFPLNDNSDFNLFLRVGRYIINKFLENSLKMKGLDDSMVKDLKEIFWRTINGQSTNNFEI